MSYWLFGEVQKCGYLRISLSVNQFKEMEEIHIYHSIWKNAVTIFVGMFFSILGIYLILNGKGNAIVWASTIIFGLGALFILYLLVRERVSDKPYLVITDKSVIMNSGPKSFEISFADVDRFLITDTFGNKMIGIRYTKEAEANKTAEASATGRNVRKVNRFIAGVPEAIPASNLSIRPGVILELLNERLEAFRKS